MATLAYLATAYSKTGDLNRAYRFASRLAAKLTVQGVNVFSPIAHGHSLSVHGKIDALDQRFWARANRVFLEKSDTLIIAHMDGWEESSGIAEEIEFFEVHGKPIFDLDVQTLVMIQRRKVA